MVTLPARENGGRARVGRSSLSPTTRIHFLQSDWLETAVWAALALIGLAALAAGFAF
jgi:hypothetical protein